MYSVEDKIQTKRVLLLSCVVESKVDTRNKLVNTLVGNRAPQNVEKKNQNGYGHLGFE